MAGEDNGRGSSSRLHRRAQAQQSRAANKLKHVRNKANFKSASGRTERARALGVGELRDLQRVRVGEIGVAGRHGEDEARRLAGAFCVCLFARVCLCVCVCACVFARAGEGGRGDLRVRGRPLRRGSRRADRNSQGAHRHQRPSPQISQIISDRLTGCTRTRSRGCAARCRPAGRRPAPWSCRAGR